MSWPELVTVMRKLRDLGLQTELAVVAFVAGTGVRRAVFARMQKTDLDQLGERIVIPVGKTDPRELPLPRGAGDVASAWTCAEMMLGFNDGQKGRPIPAARQGRAAPDRVAAAGHRPGAGPDRAAEATSP